MTRESLYMSVLNEVALEQVSFTITPELGLGFGKITADKMTDEEAGEFAEIIKSYVVPVDPASPSNCIDGRPCTGLIDGSMPEARPSIAGGAGISAWAAYEILNANGLVLGKPIDTYANVFNQLERGDIAVGGHCDKDHFEKSFDDGTTGCGASDRASEIISTLSTQAYFVSETTKALLGENYNEEVMEEVLNNASVVTSDERLKDWHGADMLNPVKDNGSRTEILLSQYDTTHGHYEQAVVFNYIKNTTIDRDNFVKETGKQTFVVDMWYLQEIAKSVAGGSDKQKKLAHAMTAFQVGTYLTLCDGHHRAIILK